MSPHAPCGVRPRAERSKAAARLEDGCSPLTQSGTEWHRVALDEAIEGGRLDLVRTERVADCV